MSKAPRTQASKLVRYSETAQQTYLKGDTIPVTGLYTVEHSEHRLPPEVTLRKGEVFPHCSACSLVVYFRLVKAAPAESDDTVFKVILYALPVLDDGNEPIAV